MIGLDDFVIATDQLHEFRERFQEIVIVDHTPASLNIYKTELKDLWTELKKSFSFCLSANESASQDDLNSIKGKYKSSASLYITCLSDIIDSMRKLETIKFDLECASKTTSVSRGGPELSPPKKGPIPESVNQPDQSGPSADLEATFSCVNVPPCDTDVFYGDYLSWPSFRDLFTAIYVNHPKLCAVQKLFHLRAKTKGEAHSVISKFSLTADNFELAWQALYEQYENKRVLVNNQLKVLLNLPALRVESGKSIKKLQSDINDCLSVLKAYKVSTSSWDPILVYLCSSRLPDKTLSQWEQTIKRPRDLPSWNEMDGFLTNQYQILETVSDIRGTNARAFNAKDDHPPKVTHHRSFHTKPNRFLCPLCKDSHPIRTCSTFLRLSVPERVSQVTALKLCHNCLSSTHLYDDCQSVRTCMLCQQRHHTLLHTHGLPSETSMAPSSSFPLTEPRVVSDQSSFIQNHNSQIQSTEETPSQLFKSLFNQNQVKVLLATALIDIHHLGSAFTLRALIDPGSEASFISEDVQRRLRLPVKAINAGISGLNSVVTITSSKSCSVVLGSKHMPSFSIQANAIVLKRLTGTLPSCPLSPEDFKEKFNFQLADPSFCQSSKIDFLIGADLYPYILLEGVKPILTSLIAQNTVFGWVISGKVSSQNISSFSTILTHFSEASIDHQLAQFWEVEELTNPKPLSYEDEFCEKLYAETTTRDIKGRYIVKLPFKRSLPMLGASRYKAQRQLIRVEKSLSKNPDIQTSYVNTLEEYFTLGHMKLVTPEDIVSKDQQSCYYLPHHAVIKPDSRTTKLRVVFNASIPSSTGVSLNDMLHVGPVLQADLMSLILQWRIYRYVFSADVEKMYRQIRVHPEHTPYQRILFRKSSQEEVQDCELETVTFGVNCAPYLAIRTLKQLAKDVHAEYPIASAIIENQFYVDDVLSGSHDLASGLEAQRQLTLALASAGFSLRKWTSNSIDLLQNVPPTHLYDEQFLKFESCSDTKTLGIQWNAKLDCFHFFFKTDPQEDIVTKRSVLSVVSKLFDPAGWIAPVIVTAKIILQQIWQDGTSWDVSLTPLTCHRWKTFFDSLPYIQTIKIPRWVQYSPSNVVQVHGFCDSSEKAYAAALYLRVQQNPDLWSTNLLCAKSKVAPVKAISLPRLELCGAVLLSKLIRKIIPTLNIASSFETYLWTDSSIVLSWLDKPSSTWKTFVANRVSMIQTYVPNSTWHHIRSTENPADIATRGASPLDLKNSDLWWHGPSWLQHNQSLWPNSIFKVPYHIDMERKPVKVHCTTSSPNIEIEIRRFSSWPKLLHALCYVYRFFYNTNPRFKGKHVYPSLDLSQHEVSHTKKVIIRLTQALHYKAEYSALLREENISLKSPLANLSPVLDPDGIIRSNGRLALSKLPYSERFPILIPYHACISTLLVQFSHTLSIHGGNQLVIRLIRCEFWIPKLNTLVRKCIRSCKTCLIHKARVRTQIMAALPAERTTLSLPFTFTGLDFAGPFALKSFAGRGCRLTKGYVCVFVCFATKAIHLEGTTDLTTQTFIAALQRFVGRRGLPKALYSDNGPNLVGANRVLNKEFKEFLKTLSPIVANQYKDQGVEWKFIPPGSPHMGGLWEAAVKSFKVHFRKTVGNQRFTFEEFSTILTRIEACLNSRPISPISENPAEILPLTPGHFLRGGPLLALPEPNASDQSLSCLKRWDKMKIIYHQFCRRWRQEYLHHLHKRYKWKHPTRNITLDDLVVIRDENLPPNEWRLGRVIKVYPGADGRVRVCDIRTQHGVLTRPIVKLCVLTND